MTQHVQLDEASGSIKKESGGKGIYRVKLIAADVQGSSGYYPAEVLERDGPRVFGSGTHIYLDHPTWREEDERPERSVKDLAAVLLDEAAYEPNAPEGKGLYSRMQVFPSHKEQVEAIAPHVGMSIRAIGAREYNMETDREEVTALIEAQSVDIVTRAGAGGRILEMTESARPAGKAAEEELYTQLAEADRNALKKVYGTMTELAESVVALNKEITDLKEKAATAKKEKADASKLSVAEIIDKLDQAALPSVSRKFLASSYAEGMDFDGAIKAEQERIEAIKAELGGNESGEGGENNEPGGETQQQESGVGRVQSGSADDVYTRANDLISFFG